MFMFVWNLNFEYWNFNAVVTVFVLKCMKMKVFVTQSCPALCDPIVWSQPGSSAHGIFQARILEWVAISFSRGSSQTRDQSWVSCIADRLFPIWATREALNPIGKQCKAQALESSHPRVRELEQWYKGPETHWMGATLGTLIPCIPMSSHTWDRAAYLTPDKALK